jgi:hypothetical protein
LADTSIDRWRCHSNELRTKLGVSATFQPWTSQLRELVGVPRHLPRILDLLDIAWIVALKNNQKLPPDTRMTESQLKVGYFVDISQGVNRKPWYRDYLPTLTQSTVLYSFEFDFVLAGRTHLHLQGFPADIQVAGLSNEQCRLLAGEAWSLPGMAPAFYAYFLASQGPWWGQQKRPVHDGASSSCSQASS